MKNEDNIENEKNELSFETAFTKLEEILEKMNSGSISLDESLKLYEKADQMIKFCNEKLNSAERKIEILIKDRKNELVLGPDQKPLQEDYMQK